MQKYNAPNFTKKIWHYLLIYAAISFGGMALPTVMGREPFILLTFFIGIFYIITQKTKESNRYLFFLTILTFSLSITFLGSDLSIGSILSTLAAFIFTYGIIACDPQNFIQRFLKIIFIISVLSIILYAMTQILGIDFFSPLFPHLLAQKADNLSSGYYGYGGFLYRWTYIHQNRNCEPFGEPGQYQGVLSVALYFSFYKKQIFKSIRQQFLFIVVFTFTLLTTLSTNGYIAMIIAYTCYFLDPNTNRFIKQKVKKLILFILIVLLLTPLGQEFIQIAILNKFIGDNGFTIEENTTGARTKGIFEMINYIQTNPSVLFGIGYDKLQELNFDTVSGLPKLLIAIGLLPFSVIIGGIIYFSKKYAQSIYQTILIFMLFISMGLGQSHIMNPCLFSMIFSTYILRIQLSKYKNKLLAKI